VKQRTIIFDENDDVISVLFKVDELPAEEEEAITGVLAR
jgi:RNA binding exosome subunit